MPELDDALKAPAVTSVASDDLVQVYDVSAHPNGAKTITAADLFVSQATALSSAQQIALLTALVNELPTSAAGLDPGELYLNTGVLTVVQA